MYFPNGKKDETRLKYKLEFYEAFLRFIDHLKEKDAKLIICGDFNTAHKEIDLARPKENSTISGFLPVERAWIDKFVAHGYIDTFRHFHKEPNQSKHEDLNAYYLPQGAATYCMTQLLQLTLSELSLTFTWARTMNYYSTRGICQALKIPTYFVR